jgi:hypothetical protein
MSVTTLKQWFFGLKSKFDPEKPIPDNQNKTLDILASNHPALLLAEVGAWLHMFGKYQEAFLAGNTELDIQVPKDVPENLKLLLTSSWPGTIWKQLGREFQANKLSIEKLITTHRYRRNLIVEEGFLKLMQDAHGRGSGLEKGALNRLAPSQIKTISSATATGMEFSIINLQALAERQNDFYKFLVETLQDMQNARLKDWPELRERFVDRVELDFRTSLADGRRPLNDVSLFDQTFASVALFKAAMAQNLLRGWQDPNAKELEKKYHWRLLRVGLDGLVYWSQATGINDMLSRKGLVEPMLDKVRDLLEMDYPLGMEAYRDHNGSILIVPDIEDLLDYELDGQRLEDKLQEIAAKSLHSEVLLDLSLSLPSRSMRLFGQLASSELSPPAAHPEIVEDWWKKGDPRQNS